MGDTARLGYPGRLRSRAWAITAALSVTETVSWGILYYAFAVFVVPMREDLAFSTAELTGAFSLGLLVSGAAGVAVGRHLDQHSPRALMTVGSIAGVLLLVGWSQVHSLAAFYLLWLAIGLVFAAVLYEPAFAVLAKQFDDPAERRRAMTTMTLVAALASFIFLPATHALIQAHGWRDALLILALILAVVTVPLHAVVLRAPAAPVGVPGHQQSSSLAVSDVFRSVSFWLLSAAFFLATIAGIAMTVHAIPFLLERGHGAGFAAFAVGLVGLSQIPGRLVFAVLDERLPAGWSTATVFSLMAAGIALTVSVDATWAAVMGLVLLGMGNGMATLARALVFADLYGAASYGTIAGVAGAVTTAARAAGPVGAAVLAAAAGYEATLWCLVALTIAAAAMAVRGERETAAVL